MKPPIHARRLLAALVTAAIAASLLPAPAVAAVAARGPVPSGARVAGVSLTGLTEVQAASAIRALVTVPDIPPLAVRVVGKRRVMLDGQGFVRVNVAAMLDAAYATTSTAPFDIAPAYSYDAAGVRLWADSAIGRYEVVPVDSKRVVVSRRLMVTKSRPGILSDRTRTVSQIVASLRRAVVSGGVAQPSVTVTLSPALPKVTESTIGKAILVVLGERRVLLYNNRAVQVMYRCAIGQAQYPTPTGLFRIVAKAANPAWHNPGSDWARSMPSYIPPGPTNPLGLRALYLNAPGIRIHGTYKIGSIGTAASHGCVRMANTDIVRFFPLVPVGTPVYIIR